jgi:flavin-binding protein dodecin
VAGTYKLITIVGTSQRSFADATRGAIKTASSSVRGISWFQVDELRGRVENDKVAEYQVTLRAGFKVEAETPAPRSRKASKIRKTPKRR